MMEIIKEKKIRNASSLASDLRSRKSIKKGQRREKNQHFQPIKELNEFFITYCFKGGNVYIFYVKILLVFSNYL